MKALRLIIENHPSWQKPRSEAVTTASNLPTPSQTIYSILGRRNSQWHTIAPRIDMADDALQAMDSANRSELFDRLVVVTATSLAGQAAGRWDTFVCAVPFTVLAPPARRSFGDLLDRAERRQAHQAVAVQSLSAPAPLNIAKRDASVWLLVLFLIGLWSQAWPVLAGVVGICALETLYQLGLFDSFIPASQRQFVQTGRFYLYSLCAGLIAIPLLAATMLKMLDFFGI